MPSRDPLERRVLEHEPALAAVVREPDGHGPVRVDPGDDALAERGVADAVARGDVGRRPGGDVRARAVARPRGGAQALALELVRGQLVEESAREVVAARAPERAGRGVRQRELLLGAREPDVAEPPLLLEHLLLERARVREDALLHADHEDGAELEAL